MWIGYARSELVPRNAGSPLHRAMHDYAARCGFGEGRVVFEPLAPEVLVHDMLAELDRRDPTATVMDRLHEVARSWGADLTPVFAPARRAEVLWQIMDSIAESAGSHLIVASREHLTHLGPSGRAAVTQLTRTRTVGVHFLDSPSPPDLRVRSQPPGPGLPGPVERVLVESRIGAIPTVAQFDALTTLSQLGWTEVIEAVDAVYVALINDLDTISKPAEDFEFLPKSAPAVIRLLTTAAGQLIVELEEPRRSSDDIAASVTAVCADTQRLTDNGRTFTRCALATPAPASDALLGGRR
ncbi:hypothetical protein [Nocardia noduli]|uniref:hypothetical protein n=1 Tax=Nocardia noduli TaxID=2815722 RepID=UPI001C22E7E8|nr:hypothetical protein [Nocardia noduli]